MKELYDSSIEELTELFKTQPRLYQDKINKYTLYVKQVLIGGTDLLPRNFHFTPLINFTKKQVGELTKDQYDTYVSIVSTHYNICNEAMLMQSRTIIPGLFLFDDDIMDSQDSQLQNEHDGTVIACGNIDVDGEGDKKRSTIDKKEGVVINPNFEEYLQTLWAIACSSDDSNDRDDREEDKYTPMEGVAINAMRYWYKKS